MRGRKAKNLVVFGGIKRKGAGSLVKIPVPPTPEAQPRPENYQQTLDTVKDKPELDLNDILAIKSSIPFKSPEWLAKSHAKAKGDKIGKSLRQVLGREPDGQVEGSYQSIEAAKSIKPTHKYCDFTGFRAKYTDKKTGIRYYSHAFYPDICQLSNTVKNQYLELRNAVVNIK